jgi:hypothetical protein
MRALFLLLVLANCAFFAWSRYLAPAESVTDPQPLARQIEPHKLRLLDARELRALPQPAAKPAPVAAGAPQACVEWGSFTLADAPRMQEALEPHALGARLGQRRTEETAGWWVFIAPQGSRAGAQKKAAELKALGVEDYFIVQEEGSLRWSLSLGVFRTEEAAQARLAALRSRGVRTAQSGPREMQVPKVWLQVRNADAAQHAQLREIARAVEGSELRDCPAGG